MDLRSEVECNRLGNPRAKSWLQTIPRPPPALIEADDEAERASDLHSPDVVIVNRQVGGSVGSDHLPLVVDFRFGAGQSRF